MTNKTLVMPKVNTRVLRFTEEDLRREYSLRTFHLKKTGTDLVVAEGEKELYTLPEQSSGIYSLGEHDYVYDLSVSRLTTLTDKYRFGGVSEPFHLVRFINKAGTERRYCVMTENVSRIMQGLTSQNGKGMGGTCCAVHAERIFTAKNFRVRYTDAVEPDVWTEGRGKGGFIDLPTDAGNILAMQSYKDKLYLFRERGITQLRVLGDELNFKALHLPFGAGVIKEESVAPCGDQICFFTERGLYAFNGGTASRVENARTDEIDLTAPVKAVSAHGKFYALVTLKEGRKSLYCVEPEGMDPHFIECGAEDIAAGFEFRFKRNGKMYALSEKGLPGGDACAMDAEGIAFTIGDEKFLDAVAIEGEGNFTVTVTTGTSERTVTGGAGTVLKLRSPLRGNGFSLHIGVNSENARFHAVLLRFKEENNDD